MITVSCSDCQKPYQIKRKTCEDSRLICKSCKYERRAKNFKSKYGTTVAKYYGSKPEYRTKQRERQLDSKYNLTSEGYNKLLENQNGVCAICKVPPDQTKRNKHLCVDHDHKTGKVRGLLCVKCNMMLGMINDRVKNSQLLSAYLMRNGERTSWDQYFLDLSSFIASRSKDLSTQVGAVIVRDRVILSTGYNGFPRGVDDNIASRHERPEKYLWTVHAEENAILNAVREGISTKNATLYVSPMHPCSNCTKAIANSGIVDVVYQDLVNNPRWAEETAKAQEIFAATKIAIRHL